MAALVVGGIYEHRIVCFIAGQLGINILHGRIESLVAPNPTDQLYVNAVELALAPLYKACLPNTAGAWRGVGVRQVGVAVAGVEVFSTASTNAGNGTTPALPKQVAGIISKKTDLSGRKNRGRLYIPFPREEDNTTDGRPDATYIAAMQAIADWYKGDATNIREVTVLGGGIARVRFGIYHRSDLSFTPCTNFVVRGEWANQRRRGGYGRTNVLPF